MIKTINTKIPYTDININIDVNGKNLIFIGKNGSGKTSILRELFQTCKEGFDAFSSHKEDLKQLLGGEDAFAEYKIKYRSNNLAISFHDDVNKFDDNPSLTSREFMLKKATSSFRNNLSEYLPRCLFSLYTRELMLLCNKNKAAELYENTLISETLNDIRRLLKDDSLSFDFCTDSFSCKLKMGDGNSVSFNNLPSGYLSVLYVYADLLLRCFAYNKSKKDLEGLVFIDNLGVNLSLEFQKQYMPFLTELFPKMQFICTTHSIFVLQSIKDATIYNLSTQAEIKDDLSFYSFENIANKLMFDCSPEELLAKAVEEIERAYEKGDAITFKELQELKRTFMPVINRRQSVIENGVIEKARDLNTKLYEKEEARQLGLPE